MTKSKEQGKRLADILSALGLSQKAFAKQTGIQQSYISVAIKGEKRGISAGMLELMLEAFPQININRIYTGTGPVLFSNQQVMEEIQEYKTRLKRIADELDDIAKD